MDEEKLAEQSAAAPAEQAPAPAPGQEPEPGKSAVFESIYDRLPDIPLKALDIFIGICVAALIIVLAVGFVQSRT